MEPDGPLERTPTLANLAGFGTGLYGSRDRRDDGSSIQTLCLSAFFVPVVPVSAYRVSSGEGRGFEFLEKVPLSRLARVYRIALALAVVSIVAFVAVRTTLRSPTRQAKRAIASANAAADAGDIERAVLAFETVVRDFDGRADQGVVEHAAARALSLHIAKVPSPLTNDSLALALEVMRRHAELGPAASSAESSQLISEVVLRWASELAQADGAAVHSAVALLDAGLAVAREQARRPMADLRSELRIRLAKTLADNRPVDALRIFVDEGQTEAAGSIVMNLVGEPSLLLEASPAVTWWLSKSDNQARIARVREALDVAEGLAASDVRQSALTSGAHDALTMAAELAPSDHELATALASLEAAEDPSVAAKRLRALGEPGWLTGRAQAALGGFHSLAGELPLADRVLTDLVRFRLPRHSAAVVAYRDAAADLRQRLADKVEVGTAEPAVMAAIRGGDDAAAQAAFADWVARSMATDSHLGELKRELEQDQYVVAASATLADVKLRRAQEASGEDRAALLQDAEAALLSVTDEAGGSTLRQLRLGLVYHRLGKIDGGNRLLESALADGDATTRLAVADIYRELGVHDRARSIAATLYEEPPGDSGGQARGRARDQIRDQAALRLAAMANTLDTAETWLSRAAPRSADARARLSEVRAELALRSGDRATALALLGEAIAHFEASAKHDAGAANNAGVARAKLYAMSGDRTDLGAARRWFNESLRIDPQSTIALDNLAEQLELEGWLTIVETIAAGDLQPLRLDRRAILDLVSDLAAGSMRRELVTSARRSSVLQRSRTLTARQRVLAPSDVRGWLRALDWALLTRNVKALSALHNGLRSRQRMIGNKTGDGSESDRAQALAANAASREIEQLAKLASAAEGRVAAIIQWKLAGELARRARTRSVRTEILSDLEKAYAASRLAASAWPALAVASVRIALELGLERAAQGSDAIASHNEARTIITALAATTKDAAALRNKLATDEAIRTAKALALGNRQLEPSLPLLALGLASGSRGLVSRNASARDEQFRDLADKIAGALGARGRGENTDQSIADQPGDKTD